MSLRPAAIEFASTWNGIRKTLQHVIKAEPVPMGEWNNRFGDVYQLCVAHPLSFSDQLYEEIRNFIINHVKELFEELTGLGPPHLLEGYYNRWCTFQKGVQYMNKLFTYLNQQFFRQAKLSEAEYFYGTLQSQRGTEQYEVGELGMEIWRNYMITPLEPHIMSVMLDFVSAERDGRADAEIQTHVIKGIITSFVTVNTHRKLNHLEVYQKSYEQHYFQASASFFRAKSMKWIRDNSASEYMKKVLELTEEEQRRCEKYLHQSSHAELRKCLEKHMVLDNLPTLRTEIACIIREQRWEDLTNMYDLLSPIQNGVTHIIEQFSLFVKQTGIELLKPVFKTENVPNAFVEAVLLLYTKYQEMIRNLFRDDPEFHTALKKTLIEISNFSQLNVADVTYRAPDLLARYCDQLLRKSSKVMQECELEDKMNKAIIVFKYIEEKDLFQKYYAKMLTKRLIHQLAHSMDAEEAMINKLKQICGYEFTNRLQRMFTDMKVSEDLNLQFIYSRPKRFELEPTPEEFNFSTFVLQSGAWPLGPAVNSSLGTLVIPAEIENYIQSFENFYKLRFSGRKLTWLYNLCQGDIKITINDKMYIITMQTYQMIVLMLFEKVDSMTCGEVRNTLSMTVENFEKTVQSVLDSKVLTIEGNLSDDNAVLKFNKDYTSKRTKVRMNNFLNKDLGERIPSASAIEEDRKLVIQACIVRTMKVHRVMRHNDLVTAVIETCNSFSPKIAVIKSVIEMLIEKKYIQRTSASRDEYSYIA